MSGSKRAPGEQTETGEALYTGIHEVTEKEVLSPQEAKQVVLAAQPGLYRTIIQTALFTGARISELLALKWPDVKLDRGTISFRRTVSTARVRATQAKKSTAGSIPRQKKEKGMFQSRPSWS